MTTRRRASKRLIAAARHETAWFGSLKRYGRGKRHDMKSVRASIARGRRREKA